MGAAGFSRQKGKAVEFVANIRKLYEVWRRVSGFLKPMGIPLHSAYTSFFLILSLFPALPLFLGLIRFTDIRIADLMDFLEGFLPQALLPTAESLIKASFRNPSGTVISLSVLASLWSASRGMFGLLGGLYAIYGGPGDRGYWKKRSISVAYTLLFLLILALTLIVHVFGTAILDFLWMATDPALMFLMSILDLRFFLLLLLQTALFAAMYALLSGKRRRLRRCIPGAVLASLGWLTFSKLFSLYVERSNGYASIFGSVYALALGMLWLYFCICILFYGSAFNRYLEERWKK